MRGNAQAGTASRRAGKRLGFISAALLALGALFLLAPAAQAGKAVIGTFGSPGGEGNGQLISPGGLAVNRTGAGGVNAGDVYVADSANSRISEFSATGAFVRSFGYDVVASGPGDTGANEKQSLAISATGGTFALKVTRGTSAATAAGSNVVSNILAPASAFHVGDEVSGGGVPAGTTITAVGAETLTLSAAATQTFANAGFSASETATNLPYNLTAAQLQAALEGLPAVGAGNVAVSGGPGGGAPLTIEYKGAFAHDDAIHVKPSGGAGGDPVSTMTTLSAGLSAEGTATLTTTTPGGGYEVCNASNPGETCKAAPNCNRSGGGAEACLEAEAAGSMDEPSGVAVDQGTGAVYVADTTNNSGISNRRVNVYSAKGAFEGAFGWQVKASEPKEELQFCTAASGCQRGSAGGGGGQLPEAGLAQPAIDPANHHLYLPEPGNFRVEEFAPAFNGSGEVTGASFVKAIGWDVVASGPDQADEVQLVTVKAGAGKFSLTFGGQTTGAKGKGNFSTGSATVTGVTTSSGSFAVGEVISTGTILPAGTTITAMGAGTLTLSQAATANSTARAITAFDLPYNVPASGPGSLEAALNGLSTVSGAGLTVKASGGPGEATGSAPYKIVFRSSPKGADVAELEKSEGTLSGGSGETSVKVSTYRQGGVDLESCVAAKGDLCKAGLEAQSPAVEDSSEHLGQFASPSPSSVAVDSSGALYAVNQSSLFPRAPSRVLKLTFPAEGEVTATEFAPKYLTKREPEISNNVSPTDIAVDPANDHVLVAKKEGANFHKLLEFDSTGTLLDESPPGAGLEVPAGGGLAIGTGERFYYSHRGDTGGVPGSRVDILGPPPAPSVAIAPVTDVGQTSATFHGTVTPPPPVGGQGFDTTYHFEYSSDGFNWIPVPVTDVAVGDGSGAGSPSECPTNDPPSCEVTQTATELTPGTEYEVRLVASSGNQAASSVELFTTEAGVPSISGMLAEEITETSAEITGFINPSHDATTYHFEWGVDESYGNRIPVASEESAGSGETPVKVNADLSGLKAATVYHFRLVASSSAGTAEGSDQEFSTLDAFGLPYGRAPEQVSPNDKRPVGMVGQTLGENKLRFQASSDGNSVAYPLENGLAGATAGGDLEYLGTRGPSGWEPTQLTPPSLVSAIAAGVGSDSTGEVMYASADLSCQLIASTQPLGEVTPELEEDVENGVRNLFRRNADATYTKLSPQPISSEGNALYHVDGVSADCDRVLFESSARLLPGAPGGTNTVLYEWEEGTGLRLAGVLPDDSVAASAVAGSGRGATNWNSMSADGSKVFFSATSNEGKDKGKTGIFMRKDGAETVDASQAQTGAVDQHAYYQMASTDGSQLFFTANYGLASNGSSTGASSCNDASGVGSGAGCDLYVYNTETEILTDLSADANPADAKGASVAGLLDASDDGTYAYFAARGQLVAGKGKTEAQNLQGNGTYNVYLSHEGDLSYVGPISDADKGTGTGSSSGGDLASVMLHWVAEATPDGSHLLFVSKANVTGYESGGVAEVYLYSVAEGTTVCISCRRDGQKSVGDAETAPLKSAMANLGGGFSSLVDVQNRPRAISEDGRHIFFTMPDALAPGAVAGTHNIYEWRGGQVYLLAVGEAGGPKDFTEYADASSDGKDVFVVTKAKFVPQDFDSTPDLYDLRAPHVPGEAVGPKPFKGPEEPCDPLEGGCQGSPAPQPEAPLTPGSEGFSGAGNPPDTGPKKPPHCRKARKCHHKKRHHKGRHHRRSNAKQGRSAR